MAATLTDRRATARTSVLAWRGWERVRLRPGRTAQVVDLSEGGALIETDWRLFPGARVELQLGDFGSRCTVGGRILRCQVAGLDAQQIRYRSALKFETRLTLEERRS